ncbi:transcriptional regulator [Humitalea rosea]|uniref:Transcriptional regulator n=1 Tax=Humitalea rosea TaxID=990373 RepID=A0A2W7HU30_9PROT|nr:LysR substrate-binding domain-containing protein [Humitalea rosea]PZW37622.1 transcriptional regulator [Humitalea rosea]
MTRHLDQRLKLRLLRAVDAIGTQRSILKASTALGIAQPALSRSLAEAEAVAGMPLFERHSRGVTPTAAGAALIATARKVLAELRRLDGELDGLAVAAHGTLALGALPVAAAGLLPGVMARLTARHPALIVSMVQGRTEDLLPRLAAGEIDLIVGRLYDPPVPDSFVRETLYEEPISLLVRAGHPLTEGASPARIAGYGLVLPTVSQRVGVEIDELLALLGLPGTMALRSSSYEFIREMLHTTDLVSVMPLNMLAGDLLRGTIRPLALPVPAPRRPAGIIRRADRPLGPAAEALTDSLRGYLAELEAMPNRHAGWA